MRHTLKAVFDQRSDAQHALDALLASGYPRADMALGEDDIDEAFIARVVDELLLPLLRRKGAR